MDEKLILMIIRYANDADKHRSVEIFPKVKNLVERHCGKNYSLAFNNKETTCFGFLMKTASKMGAIRSQLFGLQAYGTSDPAILLHGDTCLLLDIGKECDGVGFDSALSFIAKFYRQN